MNAFPYIYEIEPTNSCPYTCYMCPRGLGKMKRSVGFMSLNSFEKILAQVSPSQKLLRLHHFGESILHPDIGPFIRLTMQAGFIPVISLNPSTLTADMIELLIDSGVGIVCFSLDSLNSERLTRIRGIRKPVEYCLKMIELFIGRSRYASNPVFKVIQMVSLTINRDERAAFLSLKERFPEDDIYIYISHNYGFGDISLVNETAGGEAAEVNQNSFQCTAPYDEAVILWNGDVVVCCYDYNGSNVIGNIHEDSLSSIWHGERAERLRDTFSRKTTGKLSLCSNCFLAPHRFDKFAESQDKGLWEEGYLLNLFPPFRGLLDGKK